MLLVVLLRGRSVQPYLSLGKSRGLRIISDGAVDQTAVVAVVAAVTHAVVDAMAIPCECIVLVLSVAV